MHSVFAEKRKLMRHTLFASRWTRSISQWVALPGMLILEIKESGFGHVENEQVEAQFLKMYFPKTKQKLLRNLLIQMRLLFENNTFWKQNSSSALHNHKKYTLNMDQMAVHFSVTLETALEKNEQNQLMTVHLQILLSRF